MKRKKRTNLGVTLVEIMAVSAIISMMSGVLVMLYIQGTRIWNTATRQSDLRTIAYAAMQTMVNELQYATRTSSAHPSPNLTIPSRPNNHSIDFYLPEDKDGNGLVIDGSGNTEWETNNRIQYQYVPGQKILHRLEKGEQRIIAGGVTQIEFEDHSIDNTLYNDELRIILTLTRNTPEQRQLSITVTSLVKLRN